MLGKTNKIKKRMEEWKKKKIDTMRGRVRLEEGRGVLNRTPWVSFQRTC